MKKLFLYKRGLDKNKSIVLSEEFALVDDDDFDKVSQHKWFLMKLYHCDTEIRYVRRYEKYTGKVVAVLLHRFLLGDVGKLRVDRMDGNGLNNTKENLRICSHGQNMSNRIKKATCASKYLGVMRGRRGGWMVSCRHDKVSHRLYSFSSEKEAALAYNFLAFSLKGSFAKLNDIYV